MTEAFSSDWSPREYTTSDVLSMAVAILRSYRGDVYDRLHWVSHVLARVQPEEFEDPRRAAIWREVRPLLEGLELDRQVFFAEGYEAATSLAAAFSDRLLGVCLTFVNGWPVDQGASGAVN